jgi:hypothetical protein
MFKFINKATKKLSDYFKHDEHLDKIQSSNIEDSLIYLNSQLVIWKENSNFDDDSFNQIFSYRFNKKFMIFNLIERKIEFKSNSDKILDFKVPLHPAYTFEFLVTFAISAKNWLSLDSYNILIVHDNFDNPKILCLLSTVLSYLNKNLVHPMDLYANIISTNKIFTEMENIDAYKNIIRYINYFSMIQTNPIFEYKKFFLKTILINGAPAIENSENKAGSQHYIVINEKSYYKPVIRLISNEKVCYCSYKK